MVTIRNIRRILVVAWKNGRSEVKRDEVGRERRKKTRKKDVEINSRTSRPGLRDLE